MNVLVVNAGSTSLKFALFKSVYQKLVSGEYFYKDIVEFLYRDNEEEQGGFFAEQEQVTNHLLNLIESYTYSLHNTVILHRIVHGGGKYNEITKLTPKVINDLHSYEPLAPLHQPFALRVIEDLKKLFPKFIQYGIFDTGFHSTMPEQEKIYGLPYQLQKKLKIQRYGFHGISHEYIYEIIKKNTQKHEKVVSVHLGGGCSVCAIKKGKSVGISMGYSPEEGLIMATRSGDLSAGIILKLLENGYTKEKIRELVNNESGLKGLSDTNGDMRELLKNLKNPHNKLAFDMYIEKIAEEIAVSIVKLEGVDQLVFTGGVGFGSKFVRDKVLSKLTVFGFKKKNWVYLQENIIHQNVENPKAWAVQTDEEEQMYKIWQNMK
jgi:acetate kinase